MACVCFSGVSELTELKSLRIKSMVPDLDDMTGGDDVKNPTLNSR